MVFVSPPPTGLVVKHTFLEVAKEEPVDEYAGCSEGVRTRCRSFSDGVLNEAQDTECDWGIHKGATQKDTAEDRPAVQNTNLWCDISDEDDVNESSGPTTLIFRNLPNEYKRSALVDLLDSQSFQGKYSFVYVPTDFKRYACLGYAFVNFYTHAQAQKAMDHFQGFGDWAVPSTKVCETAWSDPVQGHEAHTERCRNSPVMHESVPDECKPAVFADGVRIPFPPPTKTIKAPRVKKGHGHGQGRKPVWSTDEA